MPPKLCDAIVAAFKYDCRLCLCSICLCGCSHSSYFCSLLLLLLLQLGSEADGRSPPPSRYVSTQPPHCADGWTLGDWLQGRERSKDGKEKGFDLFYLTVSNWIRELWGTGVKINSSWSALMVRLRAKSASEQGAHWHHVLVYFLSPFFFQQKPASRLFCVLFLAACDMGMVRECSFSPLCTSHWVYCSLNVRMLEIIWPVKCRSIGNPLEGQYPGTLSISLSTLPASSQCHPLPLLPEHSLPIFCLASAQ